MSTGPAFWRRPSGRRAVIPVAAFGVALELLLSVASLAAVPLFGLSS